MLIWRETARQLGVTLPSNTHINTLTYKYLASYVVNVRKVRFFYLRLEIRSRQNAFIMSEQIYN